MVLVDTITLSADETRRIGEDLVRYLDIGKVVSFHGDLGSGKTCMIQGICGALGVEGYVNSPTFIIINEYKGSLGSSPIPVYHFDLYRVGGVDELKELGTEDYFFGEGICLVEWAERASEILPDRRLDIEMFYLDDERRRILVTNTT
jgi:tRNA threonylcarbamoyladenosine biosynthesis protein TsaE